MKKPITIIQPEGKEVPIEIIADAIEAMSKGIKALRAGRLNDRALYLLIQDAAPSIGARHGSKKPVSVREIKAVLEGLESLEATYLKNKVVK